MQEEKETKQVDLEGKTPLEIIQDLMSLHGVRVIQAKGRRKQRVLTKKIGMIQEKYPQIITCILAKCNKITKCYDLKLLKYIGFNDTCTFLEKFIDSWKDRKAIGNLKEKHIFKYSRQELNTLILGLRCLIEKSPKLNLTQTLDKLIDSDFLYSGKIVSR